MYYWHHLQLKVKNNFTKNIILNNFILLIKMEIYSLYSYFLYFNISTCRYKIEVYYLLFKNE